MILTTLEGEGGWLQSIWWQEEEFPSWFWRGHGSDHPKPPYIEFATYQDRYEGLHHDRSPWCRCFDESIEQPWQWTCFLDGQGFWLDFAFRHEWLQWVDSNKRGHHRPWKPKLCPAPWGAWWRLLHRHTEPLQWIPVWSEWSRIVMPSLCIGVQLDRDPRWCISETVSRSLFSKWLTHSVDTAIDACDPFPFEYVSGDLKSGFLYRRFMSSHFHRLHKGAESHCWVGLGNTTSHATSNTSLKKQITYVHIQRMHL